MPTSNTPATKGGANTLAQREAVTAAFVQLVNQVPDAPDGDVTDLLGPILAAQSWEQINQVDTLPSSQTMAGHDVVVNSIAKKVSDKGSLTGYYLLCDGIDLTTGYKGSFTTGGAQAVAVLCQLHVLGALPAKVHFDAVDIKANGNQAINCRVLDVMASRTVNG